MGILRKAINGRTGQALNRFYFQEQLSRQGRLNSIFDKPPVVAPISSIIGNVNSISVASETNIQDNSVLHAAKSKLSGKVLPTMIRDNVTLESNKFAYYRNMGVNSMIQQSSLDHASNVRFYSSLSRIVATLKTQPMEKVCRPSYGKSCSAMFHSGHIASTPSRESVDVNEELSEDKLRKTLSEQSIKATPTVLSPHLPIYEPQITSTSSIFHRISYVFLATMVLSFYLLYLKMGLICFTYENFYQILFYLSKLSLISVEVTALAALSYLALSARFLILKK